MSEFLEICGKGEKAIAQNDDQQAAKIKVAVNFDDRDKLMCKDVGAVAVEMYLFFE